MEQSHTTTTETKWDALQVKLIVARQGSFFTKNPSQSVAREDKSELMRQSILQDTPELLFQSTTKTGRILEYTLQLIDQTSGRTLEFDRSQIGVQLVDSVSGEDVSHYIAKAKKELPKKKAKNEREVVIELKMVDKPPGDEIVFIRFTHKESGQIADSAPILYVVHTREHSCFDATKAYLGRRLKRIIWRQMCKSEHVTADRAIAVMRNFWKLHVDPSVELVRYQPQQALNGSTRLSLVYSKADLDQLYRLMGLVRIEDVSLTITEKEFTQLWEFIFPIMSLLKEDERLIPIWNSSHLILGFTTKDYAQRKLQECSAGTFVLRRRTEFERNMHALWVADIKDSASSSSITSVEITYDSKIYSVPRTDSLQPVTLRDEHASFSKIIDILANRRMLLSHSLDSTALISAQTMATLFAIEQIDGSASSGRYGALKRDDPLAVIQSLEHQLATLQQLVARQDAVIDSLKSELAQNDRINGPSDLFASPQPLPSPSRNDYSLVYSNSLMTPAPATLPTAFDPDALIVCDSLSQKEKEGQMVEKEEENPEIESIKRRLMDSEEEEETDDSFVQQILAEPMNCLTDSMSDILLQQ